MKLCPTCGVNPRYTPPKGRCVGYCRQCWSDRANEWREKNLDRVHKYNIKRKYNMSAEEYNTRLQAQGGVCAICKEKCVHGRLLAVDHDHKTAHNRGLLCFNCNTGLGKFRDSPAILQRAMEYLCSYMTAPKA